MEEEKEFDYPPIVLMLDLEGSLYFFRFYEKSWEGVSQQI